MSTGHPYLDDSLLSETAFARFLRAHPEIMEDVDNDKTISHAFDLPYGAGYSLTGRRIYIDRHVPLIWRLLRRRSKDHIKVHIVKYPERHEAFESACIRLLKMTYEDAHHHAVRAEHNLLVSDGFDWDDYEAQWEPLIKTDETENIQRVPPDLDLTPYESDKTLHALLSERMSSTRRTGRWKFRKK